MADSAADVPLKYDVVINGNGFILADPPSPEGPEAVYGFTPQFVARQNVQGNYGDNQQDFWMVMSQNDWSLGDGQKYLRVNDPESRARFWSGTYLDRRVPGQLSIREASATFTAAATVVSMASEAGYVYLSTSTNAYSLEPSVSSTNKGAHGLGAAPSTRGTVTDANRSLYLSTTAAGTVGVRKMTLAGVFSTFSASGADVLAYLNNTLYGLRKDTNSDLVRWDTAGTLTSLFTFKGADAGVVNTGTKLLALVPFGGKLAVLTKLNGVGEIWIYDGTAPTVVARFPRTFDVNCMVESGGTLFVGGSDIGSIAGTKYRSIYYYANGTVGRLWRETTASGNSVDTMEAYNNTLIFSASELMQYDLATGGVCSIAQTNGNGTLSGSTISFVAFGGGSTAVQQFPGSPSPVAEASAIVKTSLFDGDSSLTKYFKSVKLDVDIPTGATVAIAYQVNDVTGSYTTLTSTAVSGTEYAIGASGRSVSIQVQLTKGSSTAGPILKRIYVRAAPVQDQFRKETYVLDCTGRDGAGMVQLRNGELHPLDGKEQATNLRTAAMSTTPVTITDEFGTYTGLVDLDGFELRRVGLEQYHAVVPIRQV